jgi:hypothetical protein
MAEGKKMAAGLFGSGNQDMAQIIAARKAAAFGADPRTALLRDEGVNNINRTMQTAMRGLQSNLATSGVRGGAAGGMAIPLAREALVSRGNLERDLAVADATRRDNALSGLESTVTGERAGDLGLRLGIAGLGSADRGNANQFILGQDYVKKMAEEAKAAAAAGGAKNDTPFDQLKKRGSQAAQDMGRYLPQFPSLTVPSGVLPF